MSEGHYQEQQGLADAAGEEVADPAVRWPEHLNTPEGLWQMQDGTVIRIREGMTDKHLRNAIQWMRDRALHDHPKFRELTAERKRRKRP
jgi:hypothetical protein